MSKQLEVWYPWNNKGLPENATQVTKHLYADGFVLDFEGDPSKYLLVPLDNHDLWGARTDQPNWRIVAYTLGETRPSKRASRHVIA